MADEYYNNKIVTTDGDVLMDLTQDTATPEAVLEGETFHLRSGAPATGTYRPSDEIEARLRATVGHSNINLFNEKYRQGTSANLTITTAVTSKTIISTAIGQKHIFHNFNLDYAYVIYGLNSAGVSEVLSGRIVSTNNRLYDSGYIRQFKYVYENNISGLVAYIIMIRKPQTSGGSNWINITPDSIDQNIIMVTEYPVTSDTFEPYQEPTDSLIETKARAYLNSTVGHACKNLLELSGTSGTTSGVNFTIDKLSGTVTTANTATGQIIKLIGEVTNNYDTAKNYWLSGGADKGTSNTYYLYAIDDNTGARPKRWDGVTNSLSSYGLNDLVQIQIPAGHKIRVQILIRNGVDADGLVFKPMLRDGSIADDTFEPYVTPTDEKKQDKPVMLYDAGETSVGEHYVTGLSGFTQYSELHITLFAPLHGDDPDEGFTYTIIHPVIFPDNPNRPVTCFDCRVAVVESGTVNYKQIGLAVLATDTWVSVHEIDERGNYITIPSNHYIYIKRIVGIPK